MSKQPIRIAVTGAAGNIGYALLFRIASGAMFGPDQPVALNLIEIPPALDALKGVVMELDDCAFLSSKMSSPRPTWTKALRTSTGRCSSAPFHAKQVWNVAIYLASTGRFSLAKAKQFLPTALPIYALS